jgi:molecular chaperone GrpE
LEEELEKNIEEAAGGGQGAENAGAEERPKTPDGEERAETPDGERLELELKAARLELEVRMLELETARKTAENYQGHLRRLSADFDNYRRRTEENNKKLRDDGVTEAVKSLIDVYDTLKIAVGMTEDEAARNGMNMVLRQFKDGLYGLGAREIEAEGCTFDPNFHDAVMSEPAPEGVEAGSVLQVLNEGFVINGKVLRPATVKVAN